jgi:hypothetical protein
MMKAQVWAFVGIAAGVVFVASEIRSTLTSKAPQPAASTPVSAPAPKVDARTTEQKIADSLKLIEQYDPKEVNFHRQRYEELVQLAPDNKEYKTKLAYYTKLNDAEIAKVAANIRKEEAKTKANRRKEGVSPGMNQEDVLASSWGRPQSRHTTTFASGGTSEYWHYGGGNMLHFYNGIVDSVSTGN